jgi:hypothetical protein
MKIIKINDGGLITFKIDKKMKIPKMKEIQRNSYNIEDEEEKMSKPKSSSVSDRNSGEISTADDERHDNMKKMLAEILQKGEKQIRKFSIIDEDSRASKSLENRSTSKSSDIELSLGISKDGNIYPLVKKFCGILTKRLKNIKVKRQVIGEMISTEITYIKGLTWLTKWHADLSQNGIINSNEIETLFSNVILNIKIISDQLLKELEKRFGAWEKDTCIGDIFEKYAPFFKQYKDYCNNNEKSGRILTQLIKKNKKFNTYVNEQEKEAGQRFESFLITPIQRIPRYEMLLSSAKKYTNKNQPDYEILTRALELVKEVCAANNKEMALYTGQKRKIELNDMFGTKINLLMPQRNLIEEFTGLYMVDIDTDQPKPCNLILFTD